MMASLKGQTCSDLNNFQIKNYCVLMEHFTFYMLYNTHMGMTEIQIENILPAWVKCRLAAPSHTIIIIIIIISYSCLLAT
jgi:hypothetical protein